MPDIGGQAQARDIGDRYRLNCGCIGGTLSIAALAADTGGTDGSAWKPNDPRRRPPPCPAPSGSISTARYLDDNNSSELFEKLEDLLVPDLP